MVVTVWTGALFSMNFDISKVYEFRRAVGEKVDFGLFAYTNLWAQKVFTPLILAVGLHRKSVWMVVFAHIMFLVYFGVTQHRSHLFTPLLVYAAFFLFRRDFSYTHGFTLLACCLVGFSLTSLIFDVDALGALVVRRAFFVGPSVAYTWVEYFLHHPRVFFADNLLEFAVQNQYTGINLPHLMGDIMRPGKDIGFNVGLVGAGYAQLGAAGVALYGFVIGVFIRINRRMVEAGVPPYIHAAILFFPYRIAWADSDLFTALLSHGIIVSTFALWLFGKPHVTTKVDSRSFHLKSAGKVSAI